MRNRLVMSVRSMAGRPVHVERKTDRKSFRWQITRRWSNLRRWAGGPAPAVSRYVHGKVMKCMVVVRH